MTIPRDPRSLVHICRVIDRHHIVSSAPLPPQAASEVRDWGGRDRVPSLFKSTFLEIRHLV